MATSVDILVIDDEPDLLSMMRDILEEEGYDVAVAEHPAYVERVTTETVPSLLILDLMLPGMSGLEVAGRLRARGLDGFPIIAISASDVMVERAKRSALFAAVLAKPFDVSHLLDTVTHALGPC